jgi:hypothetical protein
MALGEQAGQSRYVIFSLSRWERAGVRGL